MFIRPTATSDLRQLFIFVLFEGQVRIRELLGRALRLGRARGPSAAARTGQGAGRCGQESIQYLVVQMSSMTNRRRSINTPSDYNPVQICRVMFTNIQKGIGLSIPKLRKKIFSNYCSLCLKRQIEKWIVSSTNLFSIYQHKNFYII